MFVWIYPYNYTRSNDNILNEMLKSGKIKIINKKNITNLSNSGTTWCL